MIDAPTPSGARHRKPADQGGVLRVLKRGSDSRGSGAVSGAGHVKNRPGWAGPSRAGVSGSCPLSRLCPAPRAAEPVWMPPRYAFGALRAVRVLEASWKMKPGSLRVRPHSGNCPPAGDGPRRKNGTATRATSVRGVLDRGRSRSRRSCSSTGGAGSTTSCSSASTPSGRAPRSGASSRSRPHKGGFGWLGFPFTPRPRTRFTDGSLSMSPTWVSFGR